MQQENSHGGAPSAEQLPTPPSVGGETVPSLPPLDSRFERGQERFEQAAEAGARASDAAASATAATAIATPAIPVQAPVVNDTTTTTTPLVAADDDLIEKEWVDKAKEIIDQTKDDPHARSQRASELRKNYLEKRYGKIVGASE